MRQGLSQLLLLGITSSHLLIGNPYNGYINPIMEIMGLLDPGTCGNAPAKFAYSQKSSGKNAEN